MPRYLFQVIDGRDIIDRVGTMLPGLREVREEAIRTAGAILRDEGDEFWNGTEWHMNVTRCRGAARAQAPLFSRCPRHRA